MYLIAHQRRFSGVFLRLLHASARRRDLVGPPDPVSNLRPVIYEDEDITAARLRRKRAESIHHPYSLDEFDPGVPDYEVRWRLERAQMDAFNHDFWTGNNTRFEAGKEAALDALPALATPEEKDKALSEFYARWLAQEAPRHAIYTKQWRRRNFALIMLEARVVFARLKTRILSILPFRSRRRQK